MNWWFVLAVSAVLLLVYAIFIERLRLILDQHVVVLNKQRKPGFSLRILHISDLHVGGRSLFRRWQLRRWRQRLQTLDYDVVAYSGDLIEDGSGIDPAVAFLVQVAEGRPILAVLGNHDYHNYSWLENILNVHTLQKMGLISDIALNNNIRRLLETAAHEGIFFLSNEGRLVRVGDSAVWFAGIDDLMLGTPNLNRALQAAPPHVPQVLISHNPDILPWAEMAGVDIILSGHTHGGQVRLPGLGPILTRCKIDRKKAAGLSLTRNGALHVSRGLGETLPVRILCAPQATIIEIRGQS